MKGVRFGSLHSFNEWGLLLKSKEIEPAPVKEYKVDISGRDGQLDYTEAFGTVHYDNRKLSFEFVKPDIVPDGFIALGSMVQGLIHGQYMDITLDDDPEWYYLGRVFFREWTAEKNIGSVKVEVEAEPYKRKQTVTSIAQSVTGSAPITLTNSRMPIVPTITADAPFTFTFDGTTATGSAGIFRIPTLVLEQGNNLVTVTGTGNVKFEYREGRL